MKVMRLKLKLTSLSNIFYTLKINFQGWNCRWKITIKVIAVITMFFREMTVFFSQQKSFYLFFYMYLIETNYQM